jgi:cytochrome b
MSRPGRIPVWDPFVRIGHWTLVAGIIAAWITAEGFGVVHEVIGYAVLAVVAARVAWGFTGSRYARFSQFVRGLAPTLSYGRRVLSRTEPRHVGHNPLGAWMIVALLLTITMACLSGALYTTDRYWGVEWVEELHEASAIAVLVLAAIHVCGVIAASLRHREDLIGAMVHGRKRPPHGDDIA